MAKNCTKGKACGGSCIASGKTCRGGGEAKKNKAPSTRSKNAAKAKAKREAAFDREMFGDKKSATPKKTQKRTSRNKSVKSKKRRRK